LEACDVTGLGELFEVGWSITGDWWWIILLAIRKSVSGVILHLMLEVLAVVLNPAGYKSMNLENSLPIVAGTAFASPKASLVESRSPQVIASVSRTMPAGADSELTVLFEDSGVSIVPAVISRGDLHVSFARSTTPR
jgi:hypothetical protein